MDTINEFLAEGNIIFHGSPLQNLRQLTPKNITKPIKFKKPVVWATPNRSYASCFSFQWVDNDNVICGQKNNKTYIIIPTSFKPRLKSPCSIYILNKSRFQQSEHNDTEWFSEKPVTILKELKYRTALRCMLSTGLYIKWLPV